jgi:hypothetical protein
MFVEPILGQGGINGKSSDVCVVIHIQCVLYNVIVTTDMTKVISLCVVTHDSFQVNDNDTMTIDLDMLM